MMESQNTNVGGEQERASSIQSEFTITIAPSDALFSSQFKPRHLFLEEVLNNATLVQDDALLISGHRDLHFQACAE